MRHSKGQNTIEYVLLVAAVMVVCIYFLTIQPGGPMYHAVGGSLNGIVNQVDNLNTQIHFQ